MPPYLLAVVEEPWDHLLGRHSDTCVGNCERDPVTAVLLSLTRLDTDGAAVGELVRVAHEVRSMMETHTCAKPPSTNSSVPVM